MNLRWSNIPIPEAHLIGLVLGFVIQIFYPLDITSWIWLRYLLGSPGIVMGILFVWWAVWVAAKMNIASPTKVLDDGPYAYSRNPMYLGWTLMIFGIAFIMNNLWILLILFFVVIYTHYFVILKEELFLKEKFGDEYEQYQKKVRRYL